MTAPVTPLPQAARPGRSQERPDPSGAAGFASALDRAAERADRASAKATAAAERAAERLERTAARTARQAERAADRAAEHATDEPADGTAPADDADAADEPTGSEAAPGRNGLPAAIWALLTGTTTVAPATAAETGTPAVGTTVGQSVTAAVVGAPSADAAAGVPTVAAAPPQGAGPAPQVPADVAAIAHGLTEDPSAVAGAPGTGGPTAVPSAAPTGEAAAALAGLTLVVEPADVAPAVAIGAAATSEGAVPASPAPVPAPATADSEAALPLPPSDTSAQDGSTSDGAASDRAASADSGGTPTAPGTAPSPETADAAAHTPPVAAATGPVAATALRATTVEGATGAGAAQPVGGQVARQVAVLRGAADGSHTMTLVLTPETLGPVEVQVTVSKGALDLTLRGAHEFGRAALLDALPDLRRDLEQAGLTVASAQVDRDTGGSGFSDRPAQFADRQPGFGDRGSQGGGDHRSRPWPGAADTTGGPTPPQRTTSSGLDVRA